MPAPHDDRSAHDSSGTLACDLDGTLVGVNTFPLFVRFTLGRLAVHRDVVALVRLIWAVVSRKLLRTPHVRFKQQVHRAGLRLPAVEIDRWAHGLLAAREHAEVRRLVTAWTGRTVLCTAAPSCYAEAFGAAAGFDAVQGSGWVDGRYVENVHEHKAQRLRGEDRPVACAITDDTLLDGPLLALADSGLVVDAEGCVRPWDGTRRSPQPTARTSRSLREGGREDVGATDEALPGVAEDRASDAQPLVISWVPFHGRSAGLALALGGRTAWMPWARAGGPRWRTVLGWARSAVRTVRLVLAAPRGSLVVVMCPPVFALVAAVLAARLSGARIAADLHSGAVNNADWAWSHGLLRRCLRRCSHVVVTNERLLDGFPTDGRPVVVLHDPPLPLVEGGQPPPLPDGPVVVFPASGGADEPLQDVVDAAGLLQGEVTVVITGRQPALAGSPHVVLPGFVDDATYAALLRRADVVLALTTREATMQRAGYEALDLGRPLVCSDTDVLREAFADAAVLTGPGGEQLAAAVRTALADRDRLVQAAERVRADLAGDVAAGVALLRRP